MATQVERRTATRAALLDACAACLVEAGYAGTTTTAVVERAGVSQGALFKHFPTKQAMLTATAAHIYDGLRVRYVERFHRIARTDDLDERLDRAIRLLYQMFESPSYGAAIDLMAAARTDDALRAGLEAVTSDHAANVRREAAALFPTVIDHPSFAITLDLILEAMVGMALSRITDANAAHYRRLLDHLTALAHERLEELQPSAPARATRKGMTSR